MENKYHAWKANSKGEPIENTDRTLLGSSKRAVLQHLAYEEGVEYHSYHRVVRCKDGSFWCVSKI